MLAASQEEKNIPVVLLMPNRADVYYDIQNANFHTIPSLNCFGPEQLQSPLRTLSSNSAINYLSHFLDMLKSLQVTYGYV